jgi:LPXTG-motif cell wall-anchored protein
VVVTTGNAVGAALPKTGANVGLIWLLMLGAGCLLLAVARRRGLDA